MQLESNGESCKFFRREAGVGGREKSSGPEDLLDPMSPSLRCTREWQKCLQLPEDAVEAEESVAAALGQEKSKGARKGRRGAGRRRVQVCAIEVDEARGR
jgi:hypothetical protein